MFREFGHSQGQEASNEVVMIKELLGIREVRAMNTWCLPNVIKENALRAKPEGILFFLRNDS